MAAPDLVGNSGRKPLVALKASRTNPYRILTIASRVIAAMAAAPLIFVTPNPALSDVQNAIDLLVAANIANGNKYNRGGKAANEAFLAALENLTLMVKQLVTYGVNTLGLSQQNSALRLAYIELGLTLGHVRTISGIRLNAPRNAKGILDSSNPLLDQIHISWERPLGTSSFNPVVGYKLVTNNPSHITLAQTTTTKVTINGSGTDVLIYAISSRGLSTPLRFKFP